MRKRGKCLVRKVQIGRENINFVGIFRTKGEGK